MAEATMRLYDYAKTVVTQEVPMEDFPAHIKYAEMAEFIKGNKYSMFLCNELHDFTVFNNKEEKDIPQITNVLKECIENRGKLLLADYLNDDAGERYEIWIRDLNIPDPAQQNFLYILFNYDWGVEEV